MTNPTRRDFLKTALLTPAITLDYPHETQNFPLASAQECRPRTGLSNFLAKANKTGSEIKIAYLGGSITAQAGWRPKTLAYFQKTYPEAKFSEVNAAIGGTGSDLGVFRLKQDVLDKNPDLLFVEFAVNDGGVPPEQIYRCVEGIVRQTWRFLPNCDICFVYTVTESLAPPMFDGKFPRAASAMEQVADHYGIPSIHMAMEVASLAKAGRLLWQAPLPKTDAEKLALGDKVVFAADGVHPYPETGHELYLQAIIRSMIPIKSASGKPRKHNLPKPMDAANYEQAKLIPLGPEQLSAGFAKLDPTANPVARNFAAQTGGLYRSAKAGETIAFKFKGTYAAIYDIIGPDCGQVVIKLDDLPARTVPRFDAFCTYHRLATLMIGSDLPDKEHTVRITIHPDQPDKVAILKQRNEKMDRPERYNDTAFYPGSILLVGQLMK
ncbi:MAG: SGNH/GDSL hydrolase family protein [Chthonomonadales bacterium]